MYVVSAFSNILESLCRFPLPYLTVPFNVVQPLLFLTVININTLNTSDVSAMTTHHMATTSQPPPLVPSALGDIDRLGQLPHATTHPPELFFLNVLQEASPDDVTTHRNTVVEEISGHQVGHAHAVNLQHVTVKACEDSDFHNSLYFGRTMNKRTFEAATKSDKDLNMGDGFRPTVDESEYVQTVTMGTEEDFHQKETSVTVMVPEHKQPAPAESQLGPGYENINSIYSVTKSLRDGHNHETEGEVHDVGINLSIASDVMDYSLTTETPPLHSTHTASDLNEEDIAPDEDTVTVRVKRSDSLEATLRNSLPPHQNSMEPSVDWGGVSLHFFFLLWKRQ